MASTEVQNGPAYLIVLGAILTGAGIMTAIFGFEAAGSNGLHYAEMISTVGFNGLPEASIKGTGYVAIGLFLAGVACMAMGNRVAYKYTNGY